MKTEDILAIAREVFDYEFKSDAQGQRLITFAHRIQAAERERCAELCEQIEWDFYRDDKCAAAIREQT